MSKVRPLTRLSNNLFMAKIDGTIINSVDLDKVLQNFLCLFPVCKVDHKAARIRQDSITKRNMNQK